MSKQRIKAGGADVELGVKDKLKAGLMRAQKRLKAFASGAFSIGGRLSAAGGAIVGPVLGAATAFAGFGDQLDKMSKRTGVSVKSLSELKFAAEQGGADVETLEKGIYGLSRSLYDAGQGSKTAVDALADLGLSFEDLESMSPEQQLETVLAKLGEVEDMTKRGAIAQKLLGRSGRQLLPMIDGLDEARQRARDLGLTLDGEGADAAAKLTDAMNEAKSSIRGMLLQVGAAVAGPLSAFLSRSAEVVATVISWIRQNGDLVRTVAMVGGILAGAGAAVIALGVVFSALASGIGAVVSIGSTLAAIFGAILSPIGLVTAAIAGAAAYFLFFTETGKTVIDWFGSNFAKLQAIVGDTFKGIFDAIAGGDLALAGKIAFTGLKLAAATILESLTSLFGSSIQAMSKMIAELYKNVATLAARVNEARVSAVNWLSGKIGGLIGVDTSLEQDAATAQAQAWSGAINDIDTSKLGDSIAAALDPSMLQEELDGLVATAKSVREASEARRDEIKSAEAPKLPGAPNLPKLAEKAFGSIGGFSVASINRNIPGKRNEEKIVKATEQTAVNTKEILAVARASRLTFG